MNVSNLFRRNRTNTTNTTNTTNATNGTAIDNPQSLMRYAQSLQTPNPDPQRDPTSDLGEQKIDIEDTSGGRRRRRSNKRKTRSKKNVKKSTNRRRRTRKSSKNNRRRTRRSRRSTKSRRNQRAGGYSFNLSDNIRGYPSVRNMPDCYAPNLSGGSGCGCNSKINFKNFLSGGSGHGNQSVFTGNMTDRAFGCRQPYWQPSCV